MKNNLIIFKNKIKNLFLEIFFPEACVICSEPGNSICERCLLDIKNQKSEENYKSIEWIHSCLSYKNPKLKTALFFLKYHYTKSISKYLAKACYQEFYDFIKKKNINPENLIIIPIPISKKRLIERNYNQSELLAKEIIQEIKENLNLDLENSLYIDLLLKNRNTIKFANTHSHTERENLIKEAFNVNPKYNKDFLENKIIIILDDITTTGSTFYEARNTLLKNNIKKENIYGFSIAH